MIPKILVAAPTSDKKDYCFKEYATQLKSFTYPNYDTYLVDNSEDDKYIETIWAEGIDADHVTPGGSPIEYISLCQNIIRNKVLAGEYSWLLMLETDNFVPNNLLEYLMGYGNEVHTFPYFILNGSSTTLCMQGTPSKLGYKLGSKLPPESSFEMFQGKVDLIENYKIGDDYELYASGTGCTFIHRTVLEKIEFRIDKPRHKAAFSDTYFYIDLKKKGIPIVLDTTLIPIHKRSNAWATDIDAFEK